MSDVARRIAGNLAEVQERIARAAARAGREAGTVTLVAVTKYVNSDVVRALYDAGCRDFGESRPQQLWLKAEALAAGAARWHMIGHLQRNKARRTVSLAHLLHSLDSRGLVEEIRKLELGRPVRALVEVNVSGDETKHGLWPDQVESFLESVVEEPAVEILGLMTMAAREGDLERARRDFAALRGLRDSLRKKLPATMPLDQLSMGMSGDYEIAIEEGATIVRVGSALFEGISL